MLQKFRIWIIGGHTGKRESALFAFLIWLIAVIYIGYLDSYNVDQKKIYNLEFVMSIVETSTFFVFAWLAAAHGFEFLNRQTRFGNPVDGNKSGKQENGREAGDRQEYSEPEYREPEYSEKHDYPEYKGKGS